MKITSIKMKKILEERLKNDEWTTSFNRDKDTFRVEWKESGKGITITLPNVIAKYESRGEPAINELEDHVTEALRIMNKTHSLEGKEEQIFPVIRAGSFPKKTSEGKKLIHSEHTAETTVFYALDLGKSYQLIDEAMAEREGWSAERIKEVASFNVRSLPVEMKKDTVYDNDFYFHSTQDGYDASRILNEALLEKLKAEFEGELAISIPHQDVIIFADVKNPEGYDILAQMAMKFFAEGTVPVTSLSFLYEDKTLEPIFILAQKRPKQNRKED
ncbi:DUF1444 domain-containing protein [Halobacillus sp. Marseille-Q1614]|uniref:DUF1444 domain-containing protein n=1 Tax=Halobacillus sp. Marseille-Q1614 TaxID=2709134 RepID=UPI00156DDECC|nr:DUF1444 domain-containing protein [Halobacillus sp. Marseille-Q1614]